MKPNKWKSHINIYWPDVHTSWKFIKPKLLEIDDFEVLVFYGSSHFSHNISTSISDCAKWNKSYISCLLSIKIFEFQSHELLEMVRTPEDFGTIKRKMLVFETHLSSIYIWKLLWRILTFHMKTWLKLK